MDHTEILDALGGRAVVAAALAVPSVRVSRWHSRSRIPAEYWPGITSLAAQAGVTGVTLDALAQAHPPRRAAAVVA